MYVLYIHMYILIPRTTKEAIQRLSQTYINQNGILKYVQVTHKNAEKGKQRKARENKQEKEKADLRLCYSQ